MFNRKEVTEKPTSKSKALRYSIKLKKAKELPKKSLEMYKAIRKAGLND